MAITNMQVVTGYYDGLGTPAIETVVSGRLSAGWIPHGAPVLTDVYGQVAQSMVKSTDLLTTAYTVATGATPMAPDATWDAMGNPTWIESGRYLQAYTKGDQVSANIDLQAQVTGVLPITNGGTGVNAQELMWPALRPIGPTTLSEGPVGDNDAVTKKYMFDNVTTPAQAEAIADLKVSELWRRSLAEAGIELVTGSFEEGATVTTRTQAVLYKATNQAYLWKGTLPKTVPSNSTPASTGGESSTTWVSTGMSLLRAQLSSTTGVADYPDIQMSRWRDEGDVRGWGAKCDNVTNDATALQQALAAVKNVKVPAGRVMYIGTKVITPRDFTLIGNNSGLRGLPGITILELPQYNGVVTGTRIDGFTFSGIGCTGIGVETPSDATSGYYRYAPRLSVHNCHFQWELAYGVNANLIFADIFNSSFGYIGQSGASKTINSICSKASDLPGATNNPNFNKIRKCYFYGGSASTTHVEFYRGGQLTLEHCDFEQGGQSIKLDKCYNVDINTCWFESCTGTVGVISIDNCDTVVTIRNSKLYRCQGADGATISYDGTTVNRLEVYNCDFEQQGNYPLVNRALTGTASIKVPPQNCITWYNNRVVSAASGVAYTSSYNYMGRGSTKANVRFNMSAGTVTVANVPVTLSKQAVGSYLLTFSDNLGVTSANGIIAQCTAYNGYVRCVPTGVNTVLINAYDGSTHALTDVQDVTVNIQ